MAKRNGLAVPASFVRQALSLPGKVERAVAELESAQAAGKMLNQVATMQQYARRIKADTRIGNCLVYSTLLLIDKLCELCPASEGGRGKKTPLPTKGVFPAASNARSAWRKVHAQRGKLPEYKRLMVEPREPEEHASLRHFLDFAHTSLVTRSSGEQEWYTPFEYIEASRKVLGKIDLDPASSHVANKTVKAARYFTAANDGLSKKWSGRVFLNPPYTRNLVGKFVEKLILEFETGHVKSAILLVNNATDTDWCQMVLNSCAAVCFPSSRVRFLDPIGAPGSPTQGQLLGYFGSHPEKFVREFLSFGMSAVMPGKATLGGGEDERRL